MTSAVDVLWTGSTAPAYAHPGDAGADLVSAEAVELAPGARRLVGTGVRIALPDGFAGFVVPRSGLAAKHGITIVNAPGTIDAGYRGEVKVALLNTDTESTYSIAVGDRIAQLIVMPVAQVRFVEADELPTSVRGHGGFGSSGYGTADVTVAATPATEGEVEDARPHTEDDAEDGTEHEDEHEDDRRDQDLADDGDTEGTRA